MYNNNYSKSSEKNNKNCASNYWMVPRPLSLFHSEQSLGTDAYCKISDCITIYNGLVSVCDSKAKSVSISVPDRSTDDIKRFSYNSRLRLLKLCGRINMDVYQDIVHVIVTYHNNFPNSSESIKRLFHNFYVRLTLKFPSCSLIWRLEFQKRGAPHYHILLLNKKNKFSQSCELERIKISNIWLDVIKEESLPASIHAVKITRTETYRKFFTYISKYAGKPEPDDAPSYSGRRWGYSYNMSVAIKHLFLPSNDIIKLFKSKLKHLLSEQNRLSKKLAEIFDDAPTLDLFVDADDALRLYNESVEYYESRFR
jgi:hypothetical protein